MADRDAHFRQSRVAVLVCLLVTALASTNAERTARAAPLSAPTFTVNSRADLDAAPHLGVGVCQATNGLCTLRAAIDKADDYPGGGVTIVLPALPGGDRYTLTIDQLTISNTMTIVGGGAPNTIIDASGVTPTTRVLVIEAGAITTISGVTIEGGNTNTGGAGIAVYKDSALTLHASLVTSNTTLGYGGGIDVGNATVTVTDSSFNHNLGQLGGGGLELDGGTTTLSRDTVSDNQSLAGDGGGIHQSAFSALNIDESTIDGNSATGNGGGIFNQSIFLTVTQSTISGNEASAGGGIYNGGEGLTASNSTISGNFAEGSGGGIFNGGSVGCCSLTLDSDTIAVNLANQAQAGGTGGGLFAANANTAQLQNTLLDFNARANGARRVVDDCAGTINANSYDLFSTTTGCVGPGPLDVKNQPGGTGPLHDNGGPTFTNALLPGSPAIDAGNPGGCTGPASAPLTTDQRGAPRPANYTGVARCDIGAFELQRTLELPLVFR